MLECNQLTKKYQSVEAVSNLTLTLEPGKIYALLGPNGSGKTTFMKMAAGLVKQSSGSLLFEKQPIGVYSKQHIAYMPTESYFYSYMTCKDVGNYYSDFFPDFNRKRFDLMIHNMELNEKTLVSKLSSGMMAKLKIAATLARDAKLIMLDEPLNGIDIIARERVISTIIDNFAPEKTFVISTHLVDELERVMDSAIFMKHGRLEIYGDAEEIRQTHGCSIVDLYKQVYADCQAQ